MGSNNTKPIALHSEAETSAQLFHDWFDPIEMGVRAQVRGFQTVAGVLAGSGVPLGILPLGTMNHFAKDLGIPTSVEGAVGVIATETARSVDLGEVSGQVFINNSSIGIYPYMVLERERERRRKRLSKWMAMILAGLRVLRHLPVFRLRIRVEGVSELIRSPCV